MASPDLDGRLTITVPEAGALLGIGRGAAYAAVRRGEIPTLQLGRRLVVPVPQLLELLGLAPEPVDDAGVDGHASPRDPHLRRSLVVVPPSVSGRSPPDSPAA